MSSCGVAARACWPSSANIWGSVRRRGRSARLLAQQRGDLAEVDAGALGAGDRHQRQAVEREGLGLPARQARLDHVRAQRVQRRGHRRVVRRACGRAR